MSSGVYKIKNEINGKVYVGSTNNFTRRWLKHRALLRHNKHQNSHLQAAWNKYGESSFTFSIIEECPIDSLLSREQFYIDTLHPEYNQTMVAGKVEMTEERRKKLSDSLNKIYAENKFPKVTKEVHQYDLKGNYIASYNSVTEASIKTNTDLSHLSSTLHGKCNIAGGYVWRFYKVDKLNVWFNRMGRKLTKEPYKPKNNHIIVSNNNETLIFKSVKEVSSTLGCTMKQVYYSLKRNSLLLKKYKVIRKNCNYG